MTHYVSVAITDPRSLFHYTVGAIKHVEYSSTEDNEGLEMRLMGKYVNF